eukprot:5659289-Amphidinium_carterae.1
MTQGCCVGAARVSMVEEGARARLHLRGGARGTSSDPLLAAPSQQVQQWKCASDKDPSAVKPKES